MKNNLRDLFTFSSGERKGIIALIFFLIVICSFNMILVLRHPAPVVNKYPDWMNDTGLLEETDKNTIAESERLADLVPVYSASAGQKKIIDPNTASLEELILAGFNMRISKTIIRYREKGGRFIKPEDVKKIYGITEEMFQTVAVNVKIKEEVKSGILPIAGPPARININTADSVMFEKLPGIGPVLARRIIRYRNLLGGFAYPGQLREVYGITDSLFIEIGDKLDADTINIKKLNVNTSQEKDLACHPYIGKYVAAGIIKYRSHAGKILNINELLKNGLIPTDRYKKIKYYLCI